ncbi:MAG TPA: hypothetical protein VFQ40_04830 [Actinomycetota bacterium]|nr:hypothetical protein [Actinomycetota bacterium]
MAKGDEATITMVVEYVDPNVGEPWNGGNRPMWFPECRFSDGSIGSGIAFSAAGATEWIAALGQVIDTPTEFKLEDNGEYKGIQKWKIKDFAGMPKSGGGGGGGGKGGGGGGMSHVHAGTLAAATILAANPDIQKLTPEDVAVNLAELADPIIDWLFKRRGGQNGSQDTGGDPAAGDSDPPAEAPAPAPADVVRLDQLRRLRELANVRGFVGEHDDANAAIAKAAGVPDIHSLTATDADELIGLWSS